MALACDASASTGGPAGGAAPFASRTMAAPTSSKASRLMASRCATPISRPSAASAATPSTRTVARTPDSRLSRPAWPRPRLYDRRRLLKAKTASDSTISMKGAPATGRRCAPTTLAASSAASGSPIASVRTRSPRVTRGGTLAALRENSSELPSVPTTSATSSTDW
ncbi:hypothetical protein D9M68_780190 [compost metagenome]